MCDGGIFNKAALLKYTPSQMQNIVRFSFVFHSSVPIPSDSLVAFWSTVIVKTNYLFVDGRYTLQANIECGKHFKIFVI